MARMFGCEAGVPLCGSRTQGRAARTGGQEMEGGGAASLHADWFGPLERQEVEYAENREAGG